MLMSFYSHIRPSSDRMVTITMNNDKLTLTLDEFVVWVDESTRLVVFK
jgi:hypothetical protein